MPGKTPAAPLLGFLVLDQTGKEDGFIAALMVTDGRGYPLEFRATTPVRPSLVQRTLYGGQLEHYVGIELCGKALLRESARKPTILLVPDRQLLDLSTETGVDAMAIWRAGETMKVEEGASTDRGSIVSSGSPFQPLVYEARFSDPEAQQATLKYLEECAATFDLVETFGRIHSALELLGKEDPRYA